MRTWLFLALLVVALAGCQAPGSTTTRRPALDKPPIEPDGIVWDAVAAAELTDTARFRFLLSARFIHEAIMPDFPRGKPKTEEDLDAENTRLLNDLKPYAATEKRLVEGYLLLIQQRMKGNFVQTDPPVYQIEYRGDYGAARGPNHARVTVTFRPKRASTPEVPQGEAVSMTVLFVQEHETWRIDGFDPDPLKGAYKR